MAERLSNGGWRQVNHPPGIRGIYLMGLAEVRIDEIGAELAAIYNGQYISTADPARGRCCEGERPREGGDFTLLKYAAKLHGQSAALLQKQVLSMEAATGQLVVVGRPFNPAQVSFLRQKGYLGVLLFSMRQRHDLREWQALPWQAEIHLLQFDFVLEILDETTATTAVRVARTLDRAINPGDVPPPPPPLCPPTSQRHAREARKQRVAQR